jgi:hypothetical protein
VLLERAVYAIHCKFVKPIHVRFTIVYRTWIGTISDLPPTVHVRYTSGATGARAVRILLVYVMYMIHTLTINVHRT